MRRNGTGRINRDAGCRLVGTFKTDSQVWNQAGADLFGWSEVVGTATTCAMVGRSGSIRDDRERGWCVSRGHRHPVGDALADEYRFLKRDGTMRVLIMVYRPRRAAGEAVRVGASGGYYRA